MTTFHFPRKALIRFCQRYKIRQLAVFGSAARGELRPESDIDLLVSFQPDAQIGFLALGQMKRELEVMLQRPVDLVPQNGLKPILRASILAEARELYAA